MSRASWTRASVRMLTAKQDQIAYYDQLGVDFLLPSLDGLDVKFCQHRANPSPM